MSAAHTLRCSHLQSARNVMRYTPKVPALAHVRLQSTVAAPTSSTKDSSLKEPTTFPSFKRILSKPEAPSPPRNLPKELNALSSHLHQFRESQRRLQHALKGPLHVRTEQVDATSVNSQVKITKSNRIHAAGKSIPNIWLRDNCPCSTCTHESTKQRLQDTFAIPRDVSIKSAVINDSKDKVNFMVDVEWSDGHKSTYSRQFLSQAALGYEQRATVRQGLVNIKLWGADVKHNLPRTTYNTVERDGVDNVLRAIRKYGFCYIDNTPATPEATEALLRRIAFIRETHYGGFYDFTADLASQDTAYTNIALEAHTDNTYFSDPAGLQAFHLLSHTDGTGGASLLVDGFQAAEQLQRRHPRAYHTLSTVNVHAHASGNDGISIQPYRGFPVLEHDPATGDLLRVRWNTSDRAGIELPVDQTPAWYDAARLFSKILKEQQSEYWEQLTPGRVLIFDNWRVLHGRSEFTGKRRICGGYINRDDWMSRFKMGRFGEEMVVGSLGGS